MAAGCSMKYNADEREKKGKQEREKAVKIKNNRMHTAKYYQRGNTDYANLQKFNIGNENAFFDFSRRCWIWNGKKNKMEKISIYDISSFSQTAGDLLTFDPPNLYREEFDLVFTGMKSCDKPAVEFYFGYWQMLLWTPKYIAGDLHGLREDN